MAKNGTLPVVEAEQPVDNTISYSSILEEHNVVRTQREVRIKLLKEIGKKQFNDDRGPNGVVAHLSKGSLSQSEIPILGNILLDVGDVETLNLILHSPGGDGTVVEKFVSLCRSQCKKFRVLIPNEAKSAATLIALGADEIVMGPPSELGPIDAQIEIIANGVPRLISAQSFIDARDKLLEIYHNQTKKDEDTKATLQMLATLDLPFIAECERLMEFGRDVATKFLESYMFKGKANKQKKVKKAVQTLSSVERFMVHGRMVNGRTARTELGLNVKMCGREDPLWKKIWEYYTRSEVAFGRGRLMKWFETEHELLTAAIPEQ
jgi:ATP-dependent protease ClpP protease subunit